MAVENWQLGRNSITLIRQPTKLRILKDEQLFGAIKER